MIRLSNGHTFEYVVASGALAFDGKGWLWERPLVWFGLIKPELFTVVIKTLTLHPRKGNLRWWKPWECVRLIRDGSVNKIGLTNKGLFWWCRKVGLDINFRKFALVGSIFGNVTELLEMIKELNTFNFVAIEINVSCPNSGDALSEAEQVIKAVQMLKEACRHPLIVKVSVDQDYLTIARGLEGVAEAIALNSVPWKRVFPNGEESPLARLEARVGGGGGGVSGKPAQVHNWKAVRELTEQGSLPVIGPSIMEFEDLARVRALGAQALSFGAIHLRTPWKPTQFVEKEKARTQRT